MSTVEEILRYVSDTLNDQESGFEYQTFSKTFLLETLNDALSRIAISLPWSLRRSEDITLTPGSVQVLPPHMTTSPTVLGMVCRRFGVEVIDNPPRRVTSVMGESADCCIRSEGMFKTPKEDPNDPCSKYKIQQYAISQNNPTMMIVSPPVPQGLSPKVRISFANAPLLAITDLFDNYNHVRSLVVDWMLHRSYSVDFRTDEVRQRAQQYYDQFYGGMRYINNQHTNTVEEGV